MYLSLTILQITMKMSDRRDEPHDRSSRTSIPLRVNNIYNILDIVEKFNAKLSSCIENKNPIPLKEMTNLQKDVNKFFNFLEYTLKTPDKTVNIHKFKDTPNLSTLLHKKAMIEEMRNCLGVVTKAASKVGISPSTHKAWMNNDEYYKDMINSIAEEVLDFAEQHLYIAIQNGSVDACKFILNAKGKERGYGKTTINNFIESSKDNLENMTTEELLQKYHSYAGDDDVVLNPNPLEYIKISDVDTEKSCPRCAYLFKLKRDKDINLLENKENKENT